MIIFLLNFAGAYDEEESAARAYDLAALKYWGTSTFTNFPVSVITYERNSSVPCLLIGRLLIRCSLYLIQISDYKKEIETMQTMTKEEYLATLRR